MGIRLYIYNQFEISLQYWKAVTGFYMMKLNLAEGNTHIPSAKAKHISNHADSRKYSTQKFALLELVLLSELIECLFWDGVPFA